MQTKILLLSFALCVSACSGGGDPKQDGLAALQASDYAGAVSSFDQALAGLGSDASASERREISLARCEALSYVDGAKAEAAFKAICTEHSDIGVNEYSLIAGAMISGKAMVNAVTVVDLGVKAFPDDPKMAKLLENVKQAAANDSAAMDALQGMGYLGGD